MTPEAPRLVPARRGFSLQYRDTQLLSSIDPQAQAERIVQGIDTRPQTLYLCPSPLLGYGLTLLLERKDSTSALLCVETDPLLHRLSNDALMPLLESRPDSIALAPLEAANTGALLRFLESRWPPRQFRRVVALKTNRGWTLDSTRYRTLEEGLRDSIHRNWQNTITLIRLGQRYTGNLIRNLPLLARAPAFETDNQTDTPILALGAGPGLDPLMNRLIETHPALRKRETRPFRIFCVDTALLPLLDRGIEPDAVLALEAQYWNLLDFIGAGAIPLILDLASHYATWRAAAADSSPGFELAGLVATRWAPLTLFDRLETAGLLPGTLPPLGSVGLSLVQLALKQTRGRVVVAGLDFSYTADAFHAKGSSHSVMHESATNRLKSFFRAERAFRPGLHRLCDKAGRPIISDPALEGYRDLFIEQFGREDRLLDAGETGLDLGLKRISPDEAGSLLFEGKNGHADSPLHAPELGHRDRPRPGVQQIGSFIGTEQSRLIDLRDILSGGKTAGRDELESRLEELDYLWAHFPEYQGTRGIADLSTDRSFLNRVRAGIDRSLKDWMIASQGLEGR